MLLASLLINIFEGNAQNDCEVLLEEIAGQYEGDCRRGLAHGEGTAVGTDTYTGEFRKGLPDGTGTYTWANGDVYEGEFKKGMKEGEGKMRIKQPDGEFIEQAGYWKNDAYIGEHESPYEIQYRSSGVLSVQIRETDNPEGDGNAIFVEFQHKGRTQTFPNYELNLIMGNFQSRMPVGNTSKILVAEFPIGFTIRYEGETVELLFYQARSWYVKIDVNI